MKHLNLRSVRASLAVFAVLALSACAGMAPMQGGQCMKHDMKQCTKECMAMPCCAKMGDNMKGGCDMSGMKDGKAQMCKAAK